MRISDWSSDVCSSDLTLAVVIPHGDPGIGDHRIGIRHHGLDVARHHDAAAFGGRPVQHRLRRAQQFRAGQTQLELEAHGGMYPRSEKRRVGKEWVSKCKSRWSPDL